MSITNSTEGLWMKAALSASRTLVKPLTGSSAANVTAIRRTPLSVNARPRDSGPPASPHSSNECTVIQQWLVDNILLLGDHIEFYARDDAARIIAVHNRVNGLKNDQHLHFDVLNSKMDSLLQKMDAAWTENTALREAYCASREETAALRAAVDTLTKKLHESTTMSAPPLPGKRDLLHRDGGDDDATVRRPQ
jgi:hypothetical protein